MAKKGARAAVRWEPADDPIRMMDKQGFLMAGTSIFGAKNALAGEKDEPAFRICVLKYPVDHNSLDIQTKNYFPL